MRFHVFILAPFVFLLKETPLMWKNYIVSCFSTTRLPMQEKTKSFTIHEERNKDKCKILLIITIKNMYGKINKGIRILFNLFPWFGPQTILLLMNHPQSKHHIITSIILKVWQNIFITVIHSWHVQRLLRFLF